MHPTFHVFLLQSVFLGGTDIQGLPVAYQMKPEFLSVSARSRGWNN